MARKLLQPDISRTACHVSHHDAGKDRLFGPKNAPPASFKNGPADGPPIEENDDVPSH